MKKLLLHLAAAVFFFAGCDIIALDSLLGDTSTELVGGNGNLEDRLDSLENRIEELEKLCSQMNSDIASIQTIVTALQGKDYVIAVKPIKEGEKEIGYTIVFAKNDPITIYHGKGSEGQEDTAECYMPVIGIRMDTDGVYYWTLDGEWLLDNAGEKMETAGDGEENVAPELEIQEGDWCISCDGGETWRTLGKAGSSSFFSGVRQDDKNVYFVLADGTELVVPKAAPLSITFDSADLVVMNPDSSREIGYTIESSSENVKIEVISSADIRAKVVPETMKTGHIQVNTSSVIDEYSKVVVLVTDGIQVVMHTLTFEAEEIEVSERNDLEAPDAGGNMTLYYMSNTECEVIIPETVDWIHVIQTKAMQEREITLQLDPNPGAARSADVVIRSDSGESIVYTIEQAANENYVEDDQKKLEREALIAFYNATDGPNWTNNTNWCSDKPVSEWYGIQTDEEGYVISINMYLNNLSGQLKAVIDHMVVLEKLKQLNLNYNNLQGPIPESIGQLSKDLESFEVWLNKITGSIPESIGNLSGLKYLVLHNNLLTGSIPESICKLNNLEKIFLYNNPLSGRVPQSLMGTVLWKNNWPQIISFTNLITDDLAIPAPDFSQITTIDGKVISDDIYSKNQLTILFGWNLYNQKCNDIAQRLLNLYTRYEGKELAVLSYAQYGSKEEIQNFVDFNNLPWDIFNESENQNFILPATAYPFVNIVNSEGMIIYTSLIDNYDRIDYILAKYFDDAEDNTEPDLYTSTDYSQDGVVTQLQKATIGNGIDIVLMGDAYSDRLIADGTYKAVMERAVNYLFTEEPYKSFKDMFNVYMVNVVSENEVYTQDSKTALKTFFGDGTFVGGNDKNCIVYALQAIPEERLNEAMVVVMMNIDAYAGTCWFYNPVDGDYGSGLTISYFPASNDEETFASLIHHEANGHGFAKLDDEYAYEYMGTITAEEIASRQELEPFGWWKNTDITNDLTKIKWSHFINDTRYANEGISAFEGASTYWTGVWRPTENSIMRYNVGDFNAPSREAIYYRIHKLAFGDSWEYNYEDFVEYDAINRVSSPAEAAQRARRNYVEAPREPLAPPVIVGKTWREVMEEAR